MWKSFLETFEGTYLDSQFLCNISSDTRVEDVGVNVIFYPLAIDIDSDEQIFLTKFLESGGKLIISAGLGSFSNDLNSFLSKQGVVVLENQVIKTPLNLKHKLDEVITELPIGSFYTRFNTSIDQIRVAARWKENSEIAISGSKNILFLGYTWGQDIDKNNDIKTLLRSIDYFWDGFSTRLTKEISKAEYKKLLNEVSSIREEANSVIQIAEQLDLPVSKYQLKKHFENGLDFVNNFNSNYLFGNFLQAREDVQSAKNQFAIVYSLGIPVRNVEIRAVWLDRGTIVGCKNPLELRSLIKNLAKIGFNVIFFETINAGCPIYPSELLPHNPLVQGWDPLKEAIDAAHTYGVQLHAWVWTFAVGNTRHNLLIGKPVQYPGPIISMKGRSWALAGENSELRIDMQPEFWLSPGNKKACALLQEVFSEIVKKYNVDGIQLDYIRFPFQKDYAQAGFDFVTKNAFLQASGKLPKKEGLVNREWREWKANLVSDFVKETSYKLKQIKPNLKISVAVFAIDHALRIKSIQQDWETWLVNKWVDVAYPFYYSFSKEEVKNKLERERHYVSDKGIIIPGFNLRVISEGELAERITSARNAGVLGVALFAAGHIDVQKKDLLKSGPFREPSIVIPYEDPLLACQKILDEFTNIIEKVTSMQEYSVLADSQIQREVYYLAKELKGDFQNFNKDKFDEIENKLTVLQKKVKDWLSLEKYLDRNKRAMYITSYLDQVKTLLNYMR